MPGSTPDPIGADKEPTIFIEQKAAPILGSGFFSSSYISREGIRGKPFPFP